MEETIKHHHKKKATLQPKTPSHIYWMLNKAHYHHKYRNHKFGSNSGKYWGLPFYHDKFPTSLNLNGAKPNSLTAVQNLPAINIPVWCPSFPFNIQYLNVFRTALSLMRIYLSSSSKLKRKNASILHMPNWLKANMNSSQMETPLAQQGGQMVDVPTNATWALRLPGTTSGGKEKETDLELLCLTGASSRNRVSE